MSRLMVIAGLFAAAVVGGITYALYQERAGEPVVVGRVQLSDITLGVPDGAIPPEGGVPERLKQKQLYATTDQIALRFTAALAGQTAVAIAVRLINDQGAIQPLQPDSVMATPGVTGYCCWTIAQPGRYQLQIFRPEGGITALPLEIIGDRGY